MERFSTTLASGWSAAQLWSPMTPKRWFNMLSSNCMPTASYRFAVDMKISGPLFHIFLLLGILWSGIKCCQTSLDKLKKAAFIEGVLCVQLEISGVGFVPSRRTKWPAVVCNLLCTSPSRHYQSTCNWDPQHIASIQTSAVLLNKRFLSITYTNPTCPLCSGVLCTRCPCQGTQICQHSHAQEEAVELFLHVRAAVNFVCPSYHGATKILGVDVCVFEVFLALVLPGQAALQTCFFTLQNLPMHRSTLFFVVIHLVWST